MDTFVLKSLASFDQPCLTYVSTTDESVESLEHNVWFLPHHCYEENGSTGLVGNLARLNPVKISQAATDLKQFCL